jgi:hypothetical protein
MIDLAQLWKFLILRSCLSFNFVDILYPEKSGPKIIYHLIILCSINNIFFFSNLYIHTCMHPPSRYTQFYPIYTLSPWENIDLSVIVKKKKKYWYDCWSANNFANIIPCSLEVQPLTHPSEPSDPLAKHFFLNVQLINILIFELYFSCLMFKLHSLFFFVNLSIFQFLFIFSLLWLIDNMTLNLIITLFKNTLTSHFMLDKSSPNCLLQNYQI